MEKETVKLSEFGNRHVDRIIEMLGNRVFTASTIRARAKKVYNIINDLNMDMDRSLAQRINTRLMILAAMGKLEIYKRNKTKTYYRKVW